MLIEQEFSGRPVLWHSFAGPAVEVLRKWANPQLVKDFSTGPTDRPFKLCHPFEGWEGGGGRVALMLRNSLGPYADVILPRMPNRVWRHPGHGIAH